MSDQTASNEAPTAPTGVANATPAVSSTKTPPKGGCAGAHAAWTQGRSGTFVMRAAPVPEIVPPPPVVAAPSPPSGELYGICNKKEIRDRMGKSFALMRRWTDGKVRPWDVFVARFGKEYHAYVNECPHQHVRLDWEKNNFFEPNYMKVLMCGKHGSQFDPATGVCISGPCEGAQLEKILCCVDAEDDVVLAGVNIDLEAAIGPAAGDPNVDEVLENDGFKLQSTKREFL
jgi:nitrite reductase/ring-hydroxylating ferredoxin subunit